MDGSSTHVCTLCNDLLKISRDKSSNRWVTTAAVTHNSKQHPSLQSAKKSTTYKKDSELVKVNVLLSHGFTGEVSATDKALAAQACFYIYSSQRISKETFEASPFKKGSMHIKNLYTDTNCILRSSNYSQIK